ncbi:ERF family protein, partial [Hungatella sp. SL.1.14]
MGDSRVMNVYEKLLKVQQELKVPKSQYNLFGKYYYRNCEDIQEA